VTGDPANTAIVERIFLSVIRGKNSTHLAVKNASARAIAPPCHKVAIDDRRV